jgi:hypothetical protein
VDGTFDTNADLTPANGRLGDANQVRQQGQFIIEGNLVSNAATYGISIDSSRDPGTNAPSPGVPLNTAAPNSARLVPGVVVANNVVSTSGTAGIAFGATTLSGNASFTTGSGALLTLGGLSDGGVARTLTKSGSGGLTLRGAAGSISDGTVMNVAAGTLTLADAAALGSSVTSITMTGGTVALGAPTTLAEFVAGARETKGSWWPDWMAWIRESDSGTVPAKGKRIPGGRGDTVIEDAPGRYVKTR